MTGLKFAIYPPAEADLPFLAVVLDGGRPLDMFGCPDRLTAERLLREMRARREPQEIRLTGVKSL